MLVELQQTVSVIITEHIEHEIVMYTDDSYSRKRKTTVFSFICWNLNCFGYDIVQ